MDRDRRARSVAEERIQGLGGLMDGESTESRTFLRGLVLGALVGAAIAGSRLWSQRHGSAAEPLSPPQREGDER